MDDFDAGFLLAIIISLVLGGLLCSITYESGKEFTKSEAISAKVAEYYIDENQNKAFRFIKGEESCNYKY